MPSQGMGQSPVCFLDLAFPAFALKLLIYLITHPQTGGPDGVSETLQTTVGIYGKFSLQGECPRLTFLPKIVRFTIFD